MAIKDEFYSPDGEEPSSKGEKPLQLTPIERAASWLAVVSKLLAAVAAIGGSGFALGRYLEEAKGLEAAAVIRAEITVKSADLEKSKNDLMAWSNAYRTLQERLAQKELQVAQLTEAVGRGRNCDFLRQQIESTKRDIWNEQHPMMQSYDAAGSAQRDQETTNRLETRLNQYLTQFGSCTKDGT